MGAQRQFLWFCLAKTGFDLVTSCLEEHHFKSLGHRLETCFVSLYPKFSEKSQCSFKKKWKPPCRSLCLSCSCPGNEPQCRGIQTHTPLSSPTTMGATGACTSHSTGSGISGPLKERRWADRQEVYIPGHLIHSGPIKIKNALEHFKVKFVCRVAAGSCCGPVSTPSPRSWGMIHRPGNLGC